MKKLTYYLLQYSWLMLGLFVLSTGIVLLVQAHLGPAPWDVFHTGITGHTPFSLGRVMIGTGIIVVIISWILGVKPYTGTILNMFFIGCFVDLIMGRGWFPVPGAAEYKAVYTALGIILCGAGTGVYISANLGSGPRDSLMIALCRITGRRVGTVRTALEISVVIAGYLLGGIFGIGTIVFSLTIGWAVEFFLNLFRKAASRPAFKNIQANLLEPGKKGYREGGELTG